MKPSKLIDLLKSAAVNRWAILIEGSPGIGKSDLVAIVAAALSATLIILHPCVSDPTDFKGYPAIVNGKAVFLTFGELEKLLTANTLTIVLIDDMGQGSQATQAALMQLVLARQINGHKISDQVVFFGATNRRTDNAGVSGILSPLRSRFRTSVELVPDVQDWCKWALSKGLPVDLIGYIQMKPAHLNTFDPKTAREGKPFACPRTLSFLGDWINAGIDDPETINGCVGESVGTEYLAFRRIFQQIGNVIPQILTNPTGAPIFDDDVSKSFAITAALTYQATAKNVDAIGQYVDRVSNEFRTFFWRAAVARKPELNQTHAFTRWFTDHSEDIC